VAITGRDPVRLERLHAKSFAAFDATDTARFDQFVATLPTRIDHVMVTAGRPHYGPLPELGPRRRGAVVSVSLRVQ
jgi:hypothetical protein